MLKRFPLYPILFAVFPILSLTAYNIEQISLDVVSRPLLVSLFLGVVLFGLARLILRDWYRAALATLAALFLFFIYGQVYNLLEDVTLGSVSIFRHRTLLPLFGILFVAILYLILRLKQPGRFTLWFNLLAIFLLVYPVAHITLSTFQQESADRSVRVSYRQAAANANRPDVYYIILDAYGRADVLQKLLGYDNREFLNALRQRGFYIADCSQSNYGYTEFSLTSSLNFNYLDDLGVAYSRDNRVALLQHSATRSFFEANGYKIVAFPTGFPFTEWRDADLYLNFEQPVTSLTEFESLILNTTALRAVTDFQAPDTSNASRKDLRRLRVYSLLDKIKKLPGVDGNLFVFAHLVVPHFPYTFGPNGEATAYRGKDATYEQTAAAYAGQVQFINQEILKVVDALIENSKVPPVIIIQGDHGPLPDLATDGAHRMPILNAYYLPGIQMDKVLYPSITPVNSFRVVLNSYFGQNLPLLKDQSYFAPLEDRNEYELVPNTCTGKP
ncbi:MAG TPA: sulfatase-like hydrolase/transferase [Anaerolineales bacterium]|nr:sulfatase-like hydrolase/transferase [Anaerolineales bacterium]